MSRRMWGLLAAMAVIGALAVATAAIAKPITPSNGPFVGTTSQKQALTLAVSKAGHRVELIMKGIEFSCSSSQGTLPLNMPFGSKNFKENEKGLPLAIKSGKFSYKGTLYIGKTHPTINFSGSFKSPKKVVGKISTTPFTAEPEPGFTGNCEALTVTFNAKYS